MSRLVKNLDLIVHKLLNGEVVGIPTETVYGLAADATNDAAVEKIFTIKNRPLTHPLIMHIAPDWDLSKWVETIPEYALYLIKNFWPGPMTLVFKLKTKTNISKLATGNQGTIAIRCPNHPVALSILNKLGRPLVAPSANPFGKVSPTEVLHIIQDFPDLSFAIIDGGRCDVGIESTIISCINPQYATILRPGIIEESVISKFCNLKDVDIKNKIRVSGNLKSHYQPHTPLIYFKTEEASACFESTENAYVIGFTKLIAKNLVNYCFPTCSKQAAREFYWQLRKADKANKNLILIELPPNKPEWLALIERIKKAGKPFYNPAML